MYEWNCDIALRWTGWSRRAWNADIWVGPVPVGKLSLVLALVGGAAWL